MSFEDIKKLEFNQYQESIKTPFTINKDLEFLKRKLTDVKVILKTHLQRK